MRQKLLYLMSFDNLVCSFESHLKIGYSIFPNVRYSHNVAIEMHDTFLEIVVAIEKVLSKAISVARLVSCLQSCIAISYN